MIDKKAYNDNFIFSLLSKKASKAFSRYSSIMFYDVRIKELFRRLISIDPLKYYFTDTTMKRIDPIDLTKCHSSKLGYLYDKYPDEFGVCICRDEHLAFAYHIGINDVKLIVTSGTNKSARITVDSFGNTSYYGINNAIAGSAIISFSSDNPEILANNILSVAASSSDSYKIDLCKDQINDFRKLNKEIRRFDQGTSLTDISKLESPIIYNTVQDLNIKSNKIWKAIKMFIFLKTAEVVEKTFVSDSNSTPNKQKSSTDSNSDIIVIDSTWDSSINIINPFPVSGHFRQQPKKNKSGEWYRETIYIDSYMKNGYSRNAKSSTDQYNKSPNV